MTKTCIGPECDREVWAKELCVGHYTQRRKGQPLAPLRKYRFRSSMNAPEGYEHCNRCESFKKRDEFYDRANGAPYAMCKDCQKANVMENYRKRKETV